MTGSGCAGIHASSAWEVCIMLCSAVESIGQPPRGPGPARGRVLIPELNRLPGRQVDHEEGQSGRPREHNTTPKLSMHSPCVFRRSRGSDAPPPGPGFALTPCHAHREGGKRGVGPQPTLARNRSPDVLSTPPFCPCCPHRSGSSGRAAMQPAVSYGIAA
jgi:hypothetical protein